MKLISNVKLISKLLTNKTFRDSYVYEHIRNGVPFQIRAMREKRGWTQGKLGELSGKPRNVITRLEDPNYGKFTITTLLEIASAFDVALIIRFAPFSRLLSEYEDTSSSALSATAISEEESELFKWAKEKDEPTVSMPISDTDIAGNQELPDENIAYAFQQMKTTDETGRMPLRIQ